MQFHEYNGKAESSLHSGMQGRAGFLQNHRNILDLMHVCLIKNWFSDFSSNKDDHKGTFRLYLPSQFQLSTHNTGRPEPAI